MRLQANIGLFDILVHLLMWLLLIIITFGIALLFFPYSFSKFIINRAYMVDAAGNEHDLVCNIDIFSNIGHIVIWFFISVFTLGIGYIFYFYRVWNYALNNTVID